MPVKNKFQKRLIKFTLWVNLILVFITLLSYLSPYLEPKYFWPISILGVLYPYLLFSNLVFILIWLLLKMRYTVISVLCILIGWNNLQRIVNWSSAQIAKEEAKITLLSYNLGYLYSLSKGSNEQRFRKKRDFKADIRELAPMILCVQENGVVSTGVIDETFIFPHKAVTKNSGAAVFSRFPILEFGEINFGVPTNSCVWADIKINMDTIRVYSFHFESNKISEQEIEQLDKGELNQSKTWTSLLDMLRKYKRSSIKRVDQVKKVKAHMDSCPYPIISAGDLNDTPQSFSYKILAKATKDSFVEQGSGIGKTYRGDIPSLKIDYIFADREMRVISHQIMDWNYSDHKPITSTLVLQ
jgi:endonuclease/exonuclease/phosphatase family metal-dependent hydrolase